MKPQTLVMKKALYNTHFTAPLDHWHKHIGDITFVLLHKGPLGLMGPFILDEVEASDGSPPAIT